MRSRAFAVAVLCAIAAPAAAQSAASGPTVSYPSASGTSEPLRNAPPAPATVTSQKPKEIPIHRLPPPVKRGHPSATARQGSKDRTGAAN